MDAVDASYHYAGIVGVQPHGMTFRQLWKMAVGRIQNRRVELFEQARLVWGLGDVDLRQYLCYGTWESTGAGGPSRVPPEIQAQVDIEIAKTYEANPELRKLYGAK